MGFWKLWVTPDHAGQVSGLHSADRGELFAEGLRSIDWRLMQISWSFNQALPTLLEPSIANLSLVLCEKIHRSSEQYIDWKLRVPLILALGPSASKAG